MLADVNVLVNAIYSASPHHERARQVLNQSLSSDGGVELAWVALLGFIRISTRHGIWDKPLAVADALSVVDEWITHPNARIVHPGGHHAGILGRLLLTCGSAGNLTTDAHLAALAIELNTELVTFDRDFKRFPGLKLQLLP